MSAEEIYKEMADFLTAGRSVPLDAVIMVAFDKNGTHILGNASKNEVALAASFLQVKFTELVLNSQMEMPPYNVERH